MDIKKYTTLAVGLIVAVVLVSGLMVPVISSLSDSGGDGNESVVIRNTDPMHNDGLPMWTLPNEDTDFEMYFTVDSTEHEISLFKTNPSEPGATAYFTGNYQSMLGARGPMVAIGDGFCIEVCYLGTQENPDDRFWSFWVYTSAGGTPVSSVSIEGTGIVVTDSESNTLTYPNVYGYIGENPTHFFTDSFYFINDGEIEDYLPPYIAESTIFTALLGLGDGESAISHGTLNNLESFLISDAWETPEPISNESLEIEYYAIEDDNALRFNQMTFDISFDVEGYGNVSKSSDDVDFPSTDGKLDLIYDWDTMDIYPIPVSFLVPAEITVESGSGSGEGNSSLSPTLTTLLSVIPLITVIGIIIGVIGYLRFKE